MKAEKSKVAPLLKTARGQIDGILNMIEEGRYCIDISHQLMATTALLNKANREVLFQEWLLAIFLRLKSLTMIT